MKKAYLDSGVLIAAFKGLETNSLKILSLLKDYNYEFYVSDAVWMEIFPKAIYNKSYDEVNFYKEIFNSCEVLIWNNDVLEKAKIIAEKYDLTYCRKELCG